MFKTILMGAALACPGAIIANAVHAAPRTNVEVAQAPSTHEGKVVSVSPGKLVMTDNAGKNEHTHAVTATAKVTLRGKIVQFTELEKGDSVKVTVSPEGVVTMIEATRFPAGKN